MVVVYDNTTWSVERFIQAIKADTGDFDGKVQIDYRRSKIHFSGKAFPLISLS